MSISRVQYRERQRLTAADLRAEQDYRLALGGRHHVSHHDWGVVRGLRMRADPGGGVTLTPGVAIDGHGREIVIDEAAVVPLAGLQECLYVLLNYCERPEQTPPGRPCADEPAPRVRQDYAVVTRRAFAPFAAGPDLAAARAAGPTAGLPPWPVLIARVCPPQVAAQPPQVDYPEIRYVRHRASRIRSPTGRAALQLGLTGRMDVYHFALSTLHVAALERRLGIDRDGVVHVWRELAICGPQVAGELLVSGQPLLLSSSRPAGLRGPILLTGTLDRRKILTLAFDFGPVSAAELRGHVALAGLVRAAHGSRIVSLEDSTGAASPWRMHVAADALPKVIGVARHARAAKKAAGAANEPTPVEVELAPTGGKLLLAAPPLAAAGASLAAPCADIDRQRDDAAASNIPVVQFRPAAALEPNPLVREIYAATTSKPSDPVPATTLFLSAGAMDNTDTSPRITFGGWTGTGAPPRNPLPVLRLDGGGRVSIKRPPGSTANDLVLLNVERALYMPPVSRKDPLLHDLLAVAFMTGLRKVGRVVPTGQGITLALKAGGSRVTRGADLVYTATPTSLNTYAMKQCFELITGIADTGDLALRATEQLPKPAAPVDFTCAKFTHPASRVRVQLYVLIKRGSSTFVVISDPLDLDVTD